MKKFLATLMVLLLLITPFLAEGLDLEAMDDSSLLALKKAVDMEYSSRIDSEPILLQPNEYVVGEDIKAGRWYARVNTYERGIDPSAYLKVKHHYADTETDGYTLYQRCRLGDPSEIVDVVDGDIIIIEDYPVSFKRSEFDEGQLYKNEMSDGICILEGKYIIGQNIPSGVYRIRTGTDKKVYVMIYEDSTACKSNDIKYSVAIRQIDPDPLTAIPLEEGNIIQISGGSVFITRSETSLESIFE